MPQHPEWKDHEPFASVLKGDMKAALAGGVRALAEIVMATHAGMTTEEFDKIVSDWIITTMPTANGPTIDTLPLAASIKPWTKHNRVAGTSSK